MICLQEVKKYCKEYWKIKNYDQAAADESQTWHCHHIHEIDWALPMEELIAIGRYYDVHYSELIFLTHSDHIRLHTEGENNPMYGKEGYWKGKVGPNKGKHLAEDHKQKIRGCNIGNQNGLKYQITKEELYNLYVVQGLSTCKIADMYNCCVQTIWHKLKKFNISKSNS